MIPSPSVVHATFAIAVTGLCAGRPYGEERTVGYHNDVKQTVGVGWKRRDVVIVRTVPRGCGGRRMFA